jgi:hypothetical protein
LRRRTGLEDQLEHARIQIENTAAEIKDNVAPQQLFWEANESIEETMSPAKYVREETEKASRA